MIFAYSLYKFTKMPKMRGYALTAYYVRPKLKLKVARSSVRVQISETYFRI